MRTFPEATTPGISLWAGPRNEEHQGRIVERATNMLFDEDRSPAEAPDGRCLAPVEVVGIQRGAVNLRVRSPLVLMPHLDESQQLLVIDDDRLGIHVYAHTRELLQEELQSQLVVLWEEYACERDEVLTVEARALKERLLQLLEKR